MPYKNKVSVDWFAPAEAITWAKNWNEVISILKVDHPDGAKVAVIPDATIQFFDGGTASSDAGRKGVSDENI
jgi:hypothetical protein